MEKTTTDYKDTMNTITEALKGNELINGMNTFIDHIHHITLENKKLKEQLKEQQLVFQEERNDLLCQLDHSHEHYGKLKTEFEKFQTEALLDKTKDVVEFSQEIDKMMERNETFRKHTQDVIDKYLTDAIKYKVDYATLLKETNPEKFTEFMRKEDERFNLLVQSL